MIETQNKCFAIICDAFKCETSYISIDASLEGLKKVLKCDMIESVRLFDYPPTVMLLDEDARLRDIEHRHFRLYQWDLLDRAIIIGNHNGEFTDVEMKLNDVMGHVQYDTQHRA
jgi:hypothetical protein